MAPRKSRHLALNLSYAERIKQRETILKLWRKGKSTKETIAALKKMDIRFEMSTGGVDRWFAFFKKGDFNLDRHLIGSVARARARSSCWRFFV